MRLKIFRLIFSTLLLLGTVFAAAAQAASEEGGGNKQLPVQVIVQIVLTAIVLRVLGTFNLP
jgi:hypothetical protein